MSTYLKRPRGQWSYYVIAGVAIALVWTGTDMVKSWMNNLPVHALPKVTSTISVADVKSLPWVWEKSPAAIQHEKMQTEQVKADSSEVNVEAVFGQKEEKPPEPPAPKFEFDKFFKENARVEAVANNGAVINGQFYELGSDMEMLAMVGERGNKIVPLLRSVNEAGILVRIGKQDVRLALSGGGGN